MSATFTAKYAGVCENCGEWFSAGSEIRYNSAREVEHAECASFLEVRDGELVCVDCFLIHPEGACVG